MNVSSERNNGFGGTVLFAALALIARVPVEVVAAPVGTAFTYQGQLKEGGVPVDGTADFQFTLWDAVGSGDPPTGGTQVGGVQAINALPVTAGLFTVALNAAGEFGPSAFNGDDRWLEVHVNGTPLTPRQPITSTPYAETALSTVGVDGHSLDAADGNPTDALFVDNAGKVGIGTNTPFGKLDVRDEGRFLAHLEGPSTLGAWLNIKSSTPSGSQWGILSSSTDNGEGPGDLVFYDWTTGQTRMDIDGPTGNVGIGTTSPDNKLHVMKGSAGAVTGHANAPLVVENSATAYINLLTPDANERGILFGSPTAGATAGGIIYNAAGTLEGLQFRTGGNSTKMVINASGGVGIGTTTPVNKLDVEGGAAIGAAYSGLSAAPTSGLIVEGNVGIGVTGPLVKLSVSGMNAGVAIFNRTGTDGTVIGINNDSVQAGSISVAGATVSYNAFTGSHYAWSDATHQPGQLVSMTGRNRRYEDRPDAEVMYGIRTTSLANAPACLGVYMNPEEPSKAAGPDNPLLVAAVGNGDLCVVDRGGDIQPGDYLISSEVPGCAMKDDPARFAVGHVVARAAERVEWAKVHADNRGVRRAKISMLFGNFVRMGSVEAMNARMDLLQRELENVRAEKDAAIAELKVRLARLESGVPAVSAVVIPNKRRNVTAHSAVARYRSLLVAAKQCQRP